MGTDRAHACLAVGKTDEHWGSRSETLEVEVLRHEGRIDDAKRLWKAIVERELPGERYREIEWNYLAAVNVALGMKEAALAKRMVKRWNEDKTFLSSSLFELA